MASVLQYGRLLAIFQQSHRIHKTRYSPMWDAPHQPLLGP